MEAKKILITGGTGFIGSHLCEKFVADGITVICLDNFMNGNLSNVRPLLNSRKFKLVKGDVRDFNLLEKIVQDTDVIIHLAAQIHVDRSIVEPKLTYDINVLGTLNILELARRYDVKRVIHSSTSEVYGSAQYNPMDEKHPLNSPHPYGASKIAADRMCYAYIQTYGMDVCIMRLFNTFGPRQKDTGYGGAISIFLRRVMNNMAPLIYGDGSQTRDYVYIKDAVKAFEAVLNSDDSLNDAVNFGTGTEIQILKLANKIIALCGKKDTITPRHISPRPGEVKKLVSDSSKAKKIYGWTPQYTLGAGLKELINWYQSSKFEQWTKPS
jgi:UDP-glucose 4-epimerase